MNKKLSETNKQNNDFILNLVTTLVLIKLWYIGWAFKWEIVDIIYCTIASIFLIWTCYIYKNLKSIFIAIYLCIMEFFIFLPHISVFSSTIPDKESAQKIIFISYIVAMFLIIIMHPIIGHIVGKHQVSFKNIIKTAFKKHTPSQEEYKLYLPWCLFLLLFIVLLSPVCIIIPSLFRMSTISTIVVLLQYAIMIPIIIYYTTVLGCISSLLSLGYIKIKGMTFPTSEELSAIKAKSIAAAAVNSSTGIQNNLSNPLKSPLMNSRKPKKKGSRLMRIVHYFIIIFITGLFLLLAFGFVAGNYCGCGNIGIKVERRF